MAIFDSIAMEYSFWIDRINPPHYPQMLDRFLPECLEHSLDAGCGPGHLSLYLSDCARQVLAIDISRSMLALAKDRMAQQRRTNIDFLCADLNDLPLLPASFDFVGSNCVLHDTPVAEALENLRRLVRPGGRLLVRDLVTRNPARATSPAWQVLRTFKQVPRYLRNFGLGDTLRLVSFEVRPAWVRHKCEGANPTPAALRSIFTRVLPGCTFADYGWALAAYWQAPPDRL